ncbi:MAG TPA: hypothetical protein VI248_05210 [Kineosporiaceae bacterium]
MSWPSREATVPTARADSGGRPSSGWDFYKHHTYRRINDNGTVYCYGSRGSTPKCYGG